MQPPKSTVVLICGGRDYGDAARMNTVVLGLKSEFPDLLIIHGAAPGADTLAEATAVKYAVDTHPFPADWDDLLSPPVRIRHRKDGTPYNAAAGPARNRKMLVHGKPDLVVAFPGGPGTADMVRQAKAAKVPVREVNINATPGFVGYNAYEGEADL